ncbi:hypothetical protein V8E51_015817 [Hyaloscypha variabilis]
MADPDSSIPMLSPHPPTVTFIEHRLPKYHPVFATSSMQYDPMVQQYVPNSQALVLGSNNGMVATGSSVAPLNNTEPLPRPVLTDNKAMKFWNDIFSAAMDRFKSTKEPKGRSQTVYNIRDKTDWDSVYDTLTLAREKYQENGGSVGRWLRRVRRKAADNITPGAEVAKIASKVVPQNPYATPVVGAVEVLLDAVKIAASVRNQVLEYFDGLIPIFSDVELFLGNFPNDKNIWNASVDLTVTTLDAIEQAIGFFISNEFVRGGTALVTGNDYEKRLLDSLDMIQTRSRNLMQEATKSHFFQANLLHEQYIQMLGDGFNGINRLLAEHWRQKDEQIKAAQEEAKAAQQEAIYLRAENFILRTASPFQPNLSARPPQHIRAPALEWYINRETLLQMLDTSNNHLDDVAFVMEKKEQLPTSERALTERIIGTQLFQNWIVSLPSAKLLVHWDFRLPKTIAGVSPLSVFCMNLAQALQGKEHFMSALFFCGLHIDAVECDGRVGGRAMLTILIVQLLRQHSFDMRPLHQDIHLAGLQEGSFDMLSKLLVWLVRQLPQTMTLLVLIDGAVLFEREEFETEALPVFSSLLQLAADPSMPASVKVLFTSTPGTNIIRGAFEDENLILNVDSLPRLGLPANEERMNRELEEELSGAIVRQGYYS